MVCEWEHLVLDRKEKMVEEWEKWMEDRSKDTMIALHGIKILNVSPSGVSDISLQFLDITIVRIHFHIITKGWTII